MFFSQTLPRIIRPHMMNEYNGQIISFRYLFNESNSIPSIILLNEWKDQSVTFHCLHSGPSHFVCGPSSLALPKALTGGGWNSSRRTANLRDTSSGISGKKKRGKKGRRRERPNCNTCKWCYSLCGNHGFAGILCVCVWLCGQNYEFSHRHGHQGVI